MIMGNKGPDSMDQEYQTLEEQKEVLMRIVEEHQAIHFNFDNLYHNRKTSNTPLIQRRGVSDAPSEAPDMAFGRVNSSVSPNHLALT
jgi:hypothetical protein